MLLVIAGGPDAVHAVLAAVARQQPVVVVAGSGGAAGIVGAAWRFLHAADQDARGIDTLLQHMAMRLGLDSSDAPALAGPLLAALEDYMAVHVFDGAHEPLNDVILGAAAHANGASVLMRVRQALQRSGASAARDVLDEHVAPADSHVLHEFLLAALEERNAALVRLLLDYGASPAAVPKRARRIAITPRSCACRHRRCRPAPPMSRPHTSPACWKPSAARSALAASPARQRIHSAAWSSTCTGLRPPTLHCTCATSAPALASCPWLHLRCEHGIVGCLTLSRRLPAPMSAQALCSSIRRCSMTQTPVRSPCPASACTSWSATHCTCSSSGLCFWTTSLSRNYSGSDLPTTLPMLSWPAAFCANFAWRRLAPQPAYTRNQPHRPWPLPAARIDATAWRLMPCAARLLCAMGSRAPGSLRRWRRACWHGATKRSQPSWTGSSFNPQPTFVGHIIPPQHLRSVVRALQNLSAVQIAHAAESLAFIAHPAAQAVLDKRWFGKFKPQPTSITLLAMFLVLPVAFLEYAPEAPTARSVVPFEEGKPPPASLATRLRRSRAAQVLAQPALFLTQLRDFHLAPYTRSACGIARPCHAMQLPVRQCLLCAAAAAPLVSCVRATCLPPAPQIRHAGPVQCRCAVGGRVRAAGLVCLAAAAGAVRGLALRLTRAAH